MIFIKEHISGQYYTSCTYNRVEADTFIRFNLVLYIKNEYYYCLIHTTIHHNLFR